MEERIRFIEHKSKRILSVDCSRATAGEMIALLDQVREAIAKNPPNSVLVLANCEAAEIDHNVAMKIKEVMTLDRPFVKKAAWIGAEHIPHALMENFHFFSQRETVTFKTKEDALDWLTKD